MPPPIPFWVTRAAWTHGAHPERVDAGSGCAPPRWDAGQRNQNGSFGGAGLMEFAFSEDQYAFRDAVADLLAGTCPPEAVRAAWDADDPWDRDRWSALAEMGVVGLMAPEAAGGLGMTEVDLVLILEEAGRAALPEPLADTALLLPLVPDEWQESIASGLIALGVAPADATHVIGPVGADFIVVGDRAYGPPDEVDEQRSVDGSRRLLRVEDVVDGDGVFRLTGDPFDRMAFGTAATLVGVARHLIDVTVEYAKERQQFGQPIGGFQAVKHHLASALLAVEFAAPAVYRAAWSLATDQPTVAPGRVDGQGHGRRRRRAGRSGRPPGPRRDRLHVRVRPPPLDEAGLGPQPGLGRRPVAPPPRRRRRHRLSSRFWRLIEASGRRHRAPEGHPGRGSASESRSWRR